MTMHPSRVVDTSLVTRKNKRKCFFLLLASSSSSFDCDLMLLLIEDSSLLTFHYPHNSPQRCLPGQDFGIAKAQPRPLDLLSISGLVIIIIITQQQKRQYLRVSC